MRDGNDQLVEVEVVLDLVEDLCLHLQQAEDLLPLRITRDLVHDALLGVFGEEVV
jgi:hypothetical protein